MKKLFFLFALVLFFSVANAQFLSDGAGSNRPLYQASLDVQGSPFLYNNWSDGSIINEKGVQYTQMRLKFDVYKNVLVFNINDTMFRFNDAVKEFVLNNYGPKATAPVKFIKSTFVHNLLPTQFVQELVTGKAGLYKHYKKTIIELASYNLVSNKTFEDRSSFFFILDNNLTAVQLSKKSLQTVLGDKWAKVDEYMQQNNLSPKSEAGWIAAITYFNTL